MSHPVTNEDLGIALIVGTGFFAFIGMQLINIGNKLDEIARRTKRGNQQ